jgi:hypothetical protein
VSLVLAHAFAALEGDGGTVLDVAGAGFVADGVEDGFGEAVSIVGAKYARGDSGPSS